MSHPRRPAVEGFEILHLLGSGAMGAVWKARRKEDDRPVALKVLHLDDEGGKGDAALRLRDEARILAGLSHPNLVDWLDAGLGPQGPWMAMELVEGETLEEVIRREAPMAPEACAALVLPLLDALAVIHHAGIIHRDVKAANVFVDGEGRPRLGDFGLARSRESRLARTATGMILGTPDTMAPEQALAGRPSPSWDLYAVATLTFRCLTARLPFPGEGAVDVLRRKQTEDPPPLRRFRPDCSSALEAVLLRSLARDPERRYGDARSFAKDLQEALAARPTSLSESRTHVLDRSMSDSRTLLAASRPSRALRKSEGTRRPLLRWSMALGALLLLLALLGLHGLPSAAPRPLHLLWRPDGRILRWSAREGHGRRAELRRGKDEGTAFEATLDGEDYRLPLPTAFAQGSAQIRLFDEGGHPSFWQDLPLDGGAPRLVPRLGAKGEIRGLRILPPGKVRIRVRDADGRLLASTPRAEEILDVDLSAPPPPGPLRVECLRGGSIPLHALLPLRGGDEEIRTLATSLGKIHVMDRLEADADRRGSFARKNRGERLRAIMGSERVSERLAPLAPYLPAYLRDAPLDDRLRFCQALLDLEPLGAMSLAFEEAPLLTPWTWTRPLVDIRPPKAPPEGPVLQKVRFAYFSLSGRKRWFTDQGRVLVGDAYVRELAVKHANLAATMERAEDRPSQATAMKFILFLDETGREILENPGPYQKAHLELTLPSLAEAKTAILRLGVVKMQTRNSIRVRINDRLAIPFRPGWCEEHGKRSLSGLYYIARRIPLEVLHEGTNRFDFVMTDLPGVGSILLTLRPKISKVSLLVTR